MKIEKFQTILSKFYYLISDYDNTISKEEVKNKLKCLERFCWWIIEVKIFKLLFVFSEKEISIIKI